VLLAGSAIGQQGFASEEMAIAVLHKGVHGRCLFLLLVGVH
jgi:hypothetical protein